ncbi:hypothetical protein JF110_001645 [Campylobacter jejuni]|nr:hypothetical protein [Campylobacter jejuni]
MMHFNDNTGKFEKINSSNKFYSFYNCLQELRLWLGENPMDSAKGIDYFSVFENKKLLRNEITRVIDKYRDSFDTIEITKLERNNKDESINVGIFFQLPNNGASIDVEFNVEPKG